MIDAEKLRALVVYLGDPPFGGNHYVGSDYAIARMKEASASILTLVEERDRLTTPRPFEQWYEDHGNVLWHLMPICEPPFCGTPLDSNWPYFEGDEERLWWTQIPDAGAIDQRWNALTSASTNREAE